MRVEVPSRESCFAGNIERVETNRRCEELERRKTGMVNRFKQYIIDLPYDLYGDGDEDTIVRKIKGSCVNIYLNTRVVRLYEMLRSTPKYYQIPWLFYDLLCFLKQSVQLNNQQTNSIPVCVSNDWMNCFSAEKLKNLNLNS